MEINGEPVDLHMKLGDNGEAFFVQETENDQVWRTVFLQVAMALIVSACYDVFSSVHNHKPGLFVGRVVCLFVIKIAQKQLDGLTRILVEGCNMGQGTTHSIFFGADLDQGTDPLCLTLQDTI